MLVMKDTVNTLLHLNDLSKDFDIGNHEMSLKCYPFKVKTNVHLTRFMTISDLKRLSPVIPNHVPLKLVKVSRKGLFKVLFYSQYK